MRPAAGHEENLVTHDVVLILVVVTRPLRKALVCVTKWGSGAAEMRAAIQHGKASSDQ